jgi:hypothetical protein
MLPNDKRIWDRFLEQFGDYFEYFDYDVRVGEGVGDIVGFDELTKEIALALTQKRIDAVGYRGDEVWVFEIKPRAGLSAIGQVTAYEVLWNRQFYPRRIYRKAIVTDRTDNDIRYLCQEKDIKLYEVGP